jgi:hypothetical protein
MQVSKLFLCLAKHDIKNIGGLEVQLQVFLTSALDEDEWSVSRPGRFNPGVKARYGKHSF